MLEEDPFVNGLSGGLKETEVHPVVIVIELSAVVVATKHEFVYLSSAAYSRFAEQLLFLRLDSEKAQQVNFTVGMRGQLHSPSFNWKAELMKSTRSL